MPNTDVSNDGQRLEESDDSESSLPFPRTDGDLFDVSTEKATELKEGKSWSVASISNAPSRRKQDETGSSEKLHSRKYNEPIEVHNPVAPP